MEMPNRTDGDDTLSGSSTVSRGENTCPNDAEAQPNRPELAARETAWVFYSKGAVMLVLLVATALVGYYTYTLTRQQEHSNFVEDFSDLATEILEISTITGTNIYNTMASISAVTTSYAMATNATWPFVTVPNFSRRCEQMLQLSGASSINMHLFVTEDNRAKWEMYSAMNQGWIQEPLPDSMSTILPEDLPQDVFPYIWSGEVDEAIGVPLADSTVPDPYYVPIWQSAPPAAYTNFNVLTLSDTYKATVDTMIATESPIMMDAALFNSSENFLPDSIVLEPIRATFENDSAIVGFMGSAIPWKTYFEYVLPVGTPPVYVVVRQSCGINYTFQVADRKAKFLGKDDRHDTRYTDMKMSGQFRVVPDFSRKNHRCRFSIDIYPTKDLEDSHYTQQPMYYTAAAIMIFIVTSAVFVMYDCLVQHRQNKVMTSATKTDAIVSSLFPDQIRDRLMEEDANIAAEKQMGTHFGSNSEPSPLGVGRCNIPTSKPIADLFPAVSVLFADICGFTAWASVKEPAQVFTLLENIYGTFDAIALRRRIFKVETIGDCYVAASGIPKARKDHAESMVRFARDCMADMNQVVHSLEIVLGPGTAELCMRFGIHSGPVTAGVLRGAKSRFQLFGDTVNTASRIETSGLPNRIHLSTSTADLLIEGGKAHWVKPREKRMELKGKGEVQTYFVDLGQAGSSSHGSMRSTHESEDPSSQNPDPTIPITARKPAESRKTQRLVSWNVEVLHNLLKQVIASRGTTAPSPSSSSSSSAAFQNLKIQQAPSTTVLDEVTEIINLAEKSATVYKCNPDDINLDPEVISQLHEYVDQISKLYKPNSFHCFEHASHVVQSMNKLISRVITPSDSIDFNQMQYKSSPQSNTMHDFTYGITSDPLIQFSCAFAGLIHDVDHSGVPNAILMQEDRALAQKYKNKSVAEQNSVSLAWNLLNQSKFDSLRGCIYQTEAEMQRFRQLVVNAVMATDIVDRDLSALRKNRWIKAFGECAIDNPEGDNTPMFHKSKEDMDRKATIVIGHLIQASDVAHTMQHWHVYLKWNERLFHEMYAAYEQGRSKEDPSIRWYEGEIGFFDYYLIPLAKKLSTCGVFGAASDEYWNYAMANRQQWALKGREIVEGYMQKYNAKKGNMDVVLHSS